MRVAALVKQVPELESLRLGPDGRLAREGVPLEMSAFCRRAVAQGVALADATGGTCTVFTLGPVQAEDVLREAIAFGADEGIHLCDPAFAGSDTLATARALASAIEVIGPFDLILVGRSSVDAETGQVGPELAQLLDLPFATGVKRLELIDDDDRVDDGSPSRSVQLGLEHDDEWVEATIGLPAVLSTAERLIDPCKIKDPTVWAGVEPSCIRRLSVADIGPGPWGQAGSATEVGETRIELVDRAGIVLDGPVASQVDAAVAYLVDRGVFAYGADQREDRVVAPRNDGEPLRAPVGVAVEPGRSHLTRELLGGAAELASMIGSQVVAIGPDPGDPAVLGRWGADLIVIVEGAEAEEDVANALVGWVTDSQPWAVLAGSTAWGREVTSRAAAALGAGLTGDAVGLTVSDGRLLAWKPAFGGSLVAGITATSPVQFASVRPGVLGLFVERDASPATVTSIAVRARRRVRVTSRVREDDPGVLANAEVVVGVGAGVDADRYGELDGLLELLGAELAATRKVTDHDGLPHARQIGVTGHSLAPILYVALGTSGKFNHMVGVRSAGTILAVNPDPTAPVFGFADVGIVAGWREVVPLLTERLARVIRDRTAV